MTSFQNCTVYFSWNLNVQTKDVNFCHLCNHFNNKLCFSVRIWDVPSKYISFCHLFNYFNTKPSFSVGIWMLPQRMQSSVIFEIISILNCLFQLEFECPNKRCKVLSSLKSFGYWTVFSSWNLNVPTKDVRFCQLEFEWPNKECKVLSSL